MLAEEDDLRTSSYATWVHMLKKAKKLSFYKKEKCCQDIPRSSYEEATSKSVASAMAELKVSESMDDETDEKNELFMVEKWNSLQRGCFPE